MDNPRPAGQREEQLMAITPTQPFRLARSASARPLPHERGARSRRRLSRTLSAARWTEYSRLLRIAVDHGYVITSLEAWLEDPGIPAEMPVLIMRHDVDQYPAAALRMAAIEARLGIRSTWYFRWRTAHPDVVSSIREEGHEVGLHYESLSRELLRHGLSAGEAPALLPRARALLREELAEFSERHGPARSACPHGDTRVPGVHNGMLLQGEDLSGYGIRWDTNAAVGHTQLDVWVTDRSSAEGRWGNSLDPIDLLIDRRSPILMVVHPNNWVSGAALWCDRIMPGRYGTADSDDPPLGRSALHRLAAVDRDTAMRPPGQAFEQDGTIKSGSGQ
jgi:hypothetical protein